MNVISGIQFLSSLLREEKLFFFARLCHELTVVARDTYRVDTDEVKDPSRLRAFNQIQHVVTSLVVALMRNDGSTYPDEVIAEIFLGEREDKVLHGLLRFSFERIASH